MRRENGFPLWVGELKCHHILEKMSMDCKSRPGDVTDISVMGNSPEIYGSDRPWLRSNDFFVTSDRGECSLASLANIFFHR